MTTPDQEYAFPHDVPAVLPHPFVEGSVELGRHHSMGMTLRDYFAGQALIGFLANPEWTRRWTETKDYNMELVAHKAYQMAAAMLQERPE